MTASLINKKSVVDPLQLLTTTASGKGNFLSYDRKNVVDGNYDTTTLQLFGAFTDAHNFFNSRLFNDMLSHVALTLNRNIKSAGHYMQSAWVEDVGATIPEININPDMLQSGAKELMSNLVHEDCHLFQHLHGKPGKDCYHNWEFARIMEHVGLRCSTTGRPGGQQTGYRMSHYVSEGGRFEQAINAMPKEYLLPFKAYAYSKNANKESHRNKVKYQCPVCRAAAWGKPGLHISCDDCCAKLIPIDNTRMTE